MCWGFDQKYSCGHVWRKTTKQCYNDVCSMFVWERPADIMFGPCPDCQGIDSSTQGAGGGKQDSGASGPAIERKTQAEKDARNADEAGDPEDFYRKAKSGSSGDVGPRPPARRATSTGTSGYGTPQPAPRPSMSRQGSAWSGRGGSRESGGDYPWSPTRRKNRDSVSSCESGSSCAGSLEGNEQGPSGGAKSGGTSKDQAPTPRQGERRRDDPAIQAKRSGGFF